jgi:uroporphyrinogen III methyltransferase/synthase
VEAFFGALRTAGRDARTLGSTQIAAIGSATAAALERHGIIPDFLPSTATGDCLAAELPRVSGARILLPAGSLSEDRLADALRARGGHIEQVRVYETFPAALDERLAERVLTADAITFASASSARFLRHALGERELLAATKLCTIGPQAASATSDVFGRVDGVAAQPSIDGLVASVLEALR